MYMGCSITATLGDDCSSLRLGLNGSYAVLMETDFACGGGY